MKFNDHELSLYASAKIGKADKEGCLWMREVEGKLRKKQSEWSVKIVSTQTPNRYSYRLCAKMVCANWKFAVLLQDGESCMFSK